MTPVQIMRQYPTVTLLAQAVAHLLIQQAREEAQSCHQHNRQVKARKDTKYPAHAKEGDWYGLRLRQAVAWHLFAHDTGS